MKWRFDGDFLNYIVRVAEVFGRRAIQNPPGGGLWSRSISHRRNHAR